MTTISKYLLACSVILLAACTSMDDIETSNSSTITANLHDFIDEESTRTLIGVDQNDQLSYRWGVGDVLGIYPDQGTQVAFELSAGSLSADGLSATFDGGAWALKNGHNYYAYFPFSQGCFDPAIDKTRIPVSYLGQKQVDFNDTSNAGQYDYNAAGASMSTSGAVSFNFVRLGALLRIKFELPATGTYQSLVLTSDADVLPISGKVDLTAGTIAYNPQTYASSLTIDLNNASGTVGQTAYVYMMLPPMTLKTQGRTLTATLNYGDKSTVYSLCTAGTTTTNIPDFKANTRYKRDAVYLSGDPTGNMSGGDDEDDDPSEMVDGHEYVDLGLPSGLKWATCNVGANAPEEYGDYFAWGETEPYYTEGHSQDDPCASWQTGKSAGYDWASYKWCNGSGNTMTKYCTSSSDGIVDNKTTLDPEDDAAHVNWGGSWRMPTEAEQDELRNYCTWTWTTQNGVDGLKVSSKSNGNFIFLPAAGSRLSNRLSSTGRLGYYWLNSLSTETLDCARIFTFDKNSTFISAKSSRRGGIPVRAVWSSQPTHEYVDLGLSVKWATMNVGATSPEEYGDYFAWGETEPYYTEGHSQDNPCTSWKTGKTGYNLGSYKWYDSSSTNWTKYCISSSYGNVDSKTTLDPEDDAAHVNWGGDWRMPTKTELDELRENCTWTSISLNGVNGRKVTGPNGNYIFLPAAGWRYYKDITDAGMFGHYWSSSLYLSNQIHANEFLFLGIEQCNYRNREFGHSVRAVCP